MSFMTEKLLPQDTTSAKLIQQKFLQALQNADSLSEALDACAMPKSALYALLFKNKSFQKAFDKIINLKLEITLIETALKSKTPAVLSFSLTNRLPKKYNKSKKDSSGKDAQKQGKIIYVEGE